MNGTAAASPRPLGPWMALALVVGNLIGSGVYILPATLAPYGWNAMIGLAVATAGALCLALVFARLGAALPAAGGPYAFTRAAFGARAGFVVAWSYWVMCWVGNGAVAVAVVSALSAVFPSFGATPGLPALLALAVVWGVTLVNIRGVASAGRVQIVTTLLKLLPLVATVLLATVLLGTGHAVPSPTVPIGAGAIAATAALAFWGFLGVESATVPADKVTNAVRIVPIVTLWGTALTGLVYLLVFGAIALLVPAGPLAASPAPIADFLGRQFGAATTTIVALFAAISAFGALNGFVLLQGEVPWAMARGGVFPAWLGKEGRRGTPVRAHLVSSALLTAVTLANSSRSMAALFTFIASVSIAAGLVAYLASALAAIKLLPHDRLLRIAAIGAAGFTLWTLWGLGLEADGWGLVLLLAGLPIYWSVHRRQSLTPVEAVAR